MAIFITYPGDADKKITIEDPDSNELIDLNFLGNPISRDSTMIYANGGYFHVDDTNNATSIVYKYAGYEGVRSFAIVLIRLLMIFCVIGWIKKIKKMLMELFFIQQVL